MCFCTGACRNGGGCAANRTGDFWRRPFPYPTGYNCAVCGAYVGNMQVHNCPGYRIYPVPPAIPTPPTVHPATKGWECPKCGAVMAWFVTTCVNCKGHKCDCHLHDKQVCDICQGPGGPDTDG